MLRRLLGALALFTLGWLFLVATAGPAGATIDGPCTASATLIGDDFTTTVDGDTADRVKIPRRADVQYQGAIDLPEGQQYTHSGEATLDVPFIDVEFWSWGDDTENVSSDGRESYDIDLPAGVLGGVKGKASGFHTQGGKTCTGALQVEIGGSVLNVGSGAAAVATAAAGAGLLAAARGKGL